MPLTEIDLAQLQRSGEHFKKILRETFENIPPNARSIAGIARWTGLNKSSCQRLVQALTKTNDGIDVIVNLPGPNSLTQFSNKFKKLIDNQSCLDDFEQMTEEYQNLIFSFATSQSELKRILQQSMAQGNIVREPYFKRLRKQAYEINKELTGESVDLYFGVHVIRENKNVPTRIDEIVVANRVGVELAKNARPFVQTFSGNQPGLMIEKPNSVDRNNFSSSHDAGNKEYLFRDFSTPEIEKCFAGVGSLGNNLIYNHSLLPKDKKKFDITTAFLEMQFQDSPLHGGPTILCQGLMQRSPAKKLILLTLMNKNLDKRSTVQGGCYPSSMRALEAGHNAEELWNDKFSDSPEIKLFYPESENLAGKTGVANVDDLIAETMFFLSEDPADYVGYYLELEYPLWLTSQRFYFDFS